MRNRFVDNRKVIIFFFATSVALAIAVWTSAPFETPTPTLFLRSPTTTSALKRKRRPPFTTRATRSILMTTSSNCFGSSSEVSDGHLVGRHVVVMRHLCWCISTWGSSCWLCSAILELQSFFTCSVCEALEATSVLATIAIKHNCFNFCFTAFLAISVPTSCGFFGHGAGCFLANSCCADTSVLPASSSINCALNVHDC